jgi:hypothetical protein
METGRQSRKGGIRSEGGPKCGQVCHTANAGLAALRSLILHERLQAEPTGLRLLFDESQQNDARLTSELSLKNFSPQRNHFESGSGTAVPGIALNSSVDFIVTLVTAR